MTNKENKDLRRKSITITINIAAILCLAIQIIAIKYYGFQTNSALSSSPLNISQMLTAIYFGVAFAFIL